MAANLLISGGVGTGLQEVLSILSKTITHVIKKTWLFKSKLKRLQETIDKITPIFSDIEKLNQILERRQEETNSFIEQLKHAEDLVKECKKIKYLNFYMRYPLSLKLDELEESLMRFFRIEVQLHQARDMKEMLVAVKDMHKRLEQRSSGSWLSGVPLPDGFVIGFDDQVKELKKMVLNDTAVDDCSVVVVSAGGGCGKTTLVTKLCHDPQIKGIRLLSSTDGFLKHVDGRFIGI